MTTVVGLPVSAVLRALMSIRHAMLQELASGEHTPQGE
jgi:hypothetical protein